MAIAALNSAATGLRALSTKIDVIANNLANAETQAFKRSRTNFEDLMYITERVPGAKNARDTLRDESSRQPQAEPVVATVEHPVEFSDEPVSVVLVDLAKAVRAKHSQRRRGPQARVAA